MGPSRGHPLPGPTGSPSRSAAEPGSLERSASHGRPARRTHCGAHPPRPSHLPVRIGACKRNSGAICSGRSPAAATTFELLHREASRSTAITWPTVGRAGSCTTEKSGFGRLFQRVEGTNINNVIELFASAAWAPAGQQRRDGRCRRNPSGCRLASGRCCRHIHRAQRPGARCTQGSIAKGPFSRVCAACVVESAT